MTENPPWTKVPDDGNPSGAEARLVQRLADRLDARVQWYPGSESELMTALKVRVLDVVIGGLDAKAPWTQEVSLTRPYVTMRTVVAGPPGTAVPDDLTGVTVAVRAGTADVATLTSEGAVIVAVDEVTGREGSPLAVGEWRLAELSLNASSHELGKHDHVWAVPAGENGWQVEVERFLLQLSHREVVDLLVEAEQAQAAA